ncbi:MAG: SusC/RagA family TonB-linked outer membrane protein [Leadbetterella sp.]
MKIKFYLKIIPLLVFFFLANANLQAQDRKVTGTIMDANDNSNLPGVSIRLKGSGKGVTSNSDGFYSIEVNDKTSVLVFSFIGYDTKEVTVGDQSVINVSLSGNENSLSEVIVTGYQQIRKKDISGAVSVVDAVSLKEMKGSSFTSNLAGRAPGVTVSGSGNPGDATNIRIRGLSSFTNNEPLYVIDGIPMQDQYQNSLSPEDIETIQVLKDASAASIYGSRASNGVIVITTKKGKSGKAKLSYNGSFGLSNPVKGYDDIMNTSSSYYQQAMRSKYSSTPNDMPDYTKGEFASSLPRYIQPVSNNPDLTKYDALNNPISQTPVDGTNWWDLMTRTGKLTDHSLSASGGNDFATFYVSGSYLKQEGVLNGTEFNRGTIRANSTYKIGKKLRLGESILFSGNWGVNIAQIGGTNNEGGVIGNYLKATPIIPQYDIRGNPGGHLSATTGNFTNPTTILEQNKVNKNNYTRFLSAFYAEYDVLKGLTLKTNFAADLGNGFAKRFEYPTPYRPEGNKTGNSFREFWNKNFQYTWTNTVNYAKTFGKNTLNVFAGSEAINQVNRDAYLYLANYFTLDPNAFYINTAFGDPGSRTVSSGGGESALFSLFGKVDYTFADKYILSGTLRRDQSSKFANDVRTGYFPAASFAWRLSQESFMKELNWLSDLKLRIAYGEVGNQNIRNYNFSDNYGGTVGSTFYDVNGTNNSPSTGYALRSYGNAGTKWESANSMNFGLDGGLLNNSIQFVLDVYKRNTNNLLYDPKLPFTAGGASAPFINVGSMQNTGYDFSVTYRKSLKRDMKFTSTLNLSQYKNKINKVSDDADYFYPNDNISERIPQGSNVQINRVGYPFASHRGFIVDGIIKTEAEKTAGPAGSAIGGLKFKDISGPEGKPDGKITDDDLTIIGNPHPKLTGGLDLGFSYKNFDVNAFLLGVFGNDIYNVTKIYNVFTQFNSNVINDILEREKNDPNWPKMNSLDAGSRNSSTFYVEKGSYVRMSNLQLGYKIPVKNLKSMGFSSARVYLQAQNLFTITNYSGVDPAVSSANIGNSGNVNDTRLGVDNGHYPANRITSLGINLEF